MSGNTHNKNKVTDITYNITRILGYNKLDIVNMNINSTIVPKLLAEIHDELIDRFMESSKRRVVGVLRLLFPINKDGYIVPVHFIMKVLPNLNDGLQFVSFVKEINEMYCYPYKIPTNMPIEDIEHFLIYKYDKSNMIVSGITQSLNKYFGIPALLTNN